MYRGRMNQQELFLLADATLRSVIDQLTPEQLAAHVERFVETSALRSVTNQSSSVEIGTVRSLPVPPPAEPKK